MAKSAPSFAGYNLCASACTAIFAAGRHRAAGENARFVFHSGTCRPRPISFDDPFGGDPDRYHVPADDGAHSVGA